jgi:hypothetical protein
VLTPGVILVGVAFEAVLRWHARRRLAVLRVLAALVPVGLLAGAALQVVRERGDQQVAQREVLDLVHELFPEPVPYVDRCSMVATFPKAGFFMSTLGMAQYLEGGRPIFEELIRTRRPRFVLANAYPLRLAWPTRTPVRGYQRLLPEDARALRTHYVHHWGALYVPGQRLDVVRQQGGTTFEILVPGTYTLEASAALLLDGAAVEPGTALALTAGEHAFEGGGAGPIILRWGDHLARPDRPPTPQALFTGL